MIDLDTTFDLDLEEDRERARQYLGGGKTPGSRYGSDADACAPVAIAVAHILAAETGEETTGYSLNEVMGWVVNDSDEPMDIINRDGQRHGHDPNELLDTEFVALRHRDDVKVWSISHGLPGYLPDDVYFVAGDADDAADALEDELDRFELDVAELRDMVADQEHLDGLSIVTDNEVWEMSPVVEIPDEVLDLPVYQAMEKMNDR